MFSVLVAGTALLAGACGSSPAGQSVAHLGTTTTTHQAGSGSNGSQTGSGPGPGQAIGIRGGGAGEEADALAYAECMRAHGVPNFPDPNSQGGFSIQGGPGSGIDPSSASFQAADKTCRHLLPNGGQPTAAQQAQAMAQALRFSQCMRSHGVPDFPDPQALPGGGIAIRIRARPGSGSDLNPQSPQFQAAQKACQGKGGLFGAGPKKSAAGAGGAPG